MTNQELFTTVRRHLLKQNAKSIQKQSMLTGDTICLYRHPSGLRCAIGCLIPDDKYKLTMESIGVSNEDVRLAAGIRDEQVNLARELQNLHDNRAVEDWPLLLDSMARDYSLVIED
jgi:hypothetical protein